MLDPLGGRAVTLNCTTVENRTSLSALDPALAPDQPLDEDLIAAFYVIAAFFGLDDDREH